jgi:hypothetical protein
MTTQQRSWVPLESYARKRDAQAIADNLWKNGEKYHAGVYDYEQYKRRNADLWAEAEARNVADFVKRILRMAAIG